MKNIFLGTLILFCLSSWVFASSAQVYSGEASPVPTYSNEASLSQMYDQVFDSIKLRHGYSYTFGDIFINNTNGPVWLSDYRYTFTESANFNQGESNPHFPWTQEIINQGYIVPSGDRLKVVDSTPPYSIIYHPVVRSENNITIVYEAEYYRNAGQSNQTGPFTHTEFQPYEITWCGDGVVDNYLDVYSNSQIVEQCDLWLQNGVLNSGCSAECTTVNTPVASIAINKLDSNTADIDGTTWNDTQTVVFWEAAVFNITVTNNGTDNLGTINMG